MARYVIANRRAGKFLESEKLASRAAVESTMARVAGGVDIVNDLNPPDPLARRVVVVDADPKDMQLANMHPDVMIEPEILHWPGGTPPGDFLDRRRLQAMSAAAGAGAGVAGAGALAGAPAAALNVTVQGGGAPLNGAKVLLFLRGLGTNSQMEQLTDMNGRASFAFASFQSASALVVEPAGGFWTVVVRGPSRDVVVDCPSLPVTGPLAWWHNAVGIAAFDATRGAGIKVGVADTGVGPHRYLGHVTRVGAFIDGSALPEAETVDADSHGSHVCGIIGARPTDAGDFGGIAPGVDLFCARVFPPGKGANQGDIVNAIDALSRTRGVDLINLSLGAPSPSQMEQDTIRDALERGTLCICAAGNDNGPVGFPAAFEECVAVSALGLLGFGPDGTLAATRLPQDSARFAAENLYLANFSCFGSQIECSAPGVGIISTVPERFGLAGPYAALDGTSMASPAACAAIAVMLSGSPEYLALPRDVSRAQQARAILRAKCRDIGLSSDLEGFGVPDTSQ